MPARVEKSASPVEVYGSCASRAYSFNGARAERVGRKYSHARLATVVEQASDAILIADPSGIIEYVNPAFERVTGYSREDVIGRNSRMFNGRDTKSALFENMWDTIKRGVVWKGALDNKRKDGTTYQVELTVSPVFGASGKIVSYSALMRDITQEMELETRLRQAEKMEAIGQLASGVAHDFNNVLTAILGHVSLLSAAVRDDAGPSGALADGIEQIERAARQGAALTRQLLNFNRKRPTHLEPVQPDRVLRDTERMLRRLIAQNISLDLRPTPNLDAVLADVCQLEQIILNLALNARDAMPDGGVLTISTERANLDESYAAVHHDAATGPHVLIRVRDTGAGMPPDVLAHIFEPFFTTKSPGKGTGLGLATVYGIVQRFGGHITVQSSPGEGTEFRVYLPSTTRSSKETQTPTDPETRPRGSETVLVCEDDEVIRELQCEILERHGYRVLSAADGESAAGLVANADIDLLLTDVMMPGISGAVLADRLRASQPNLKVLFVSGYPDDAPNRANQTIPLLPKPFTAPDLLTHVRQAIGEAT